MRGVDSDFEAATKKNADGAAEVSAMRSKSNTVFFFPCGYPPCPQFPVSGRSPPYPAFYPAGVSCNWFCFLRIPRYPGYPAVFAKGRGRNRQGGKGGVEGKNRAYTYHWCTKTKGKRWPMKAHYRTASGRSRLSWRARHETIQKLGRSRRVDDRKRGRRNLSLRRSLEH